MLKRFLFTAMIALSLLPGIVTAQNFTGQLDSAGEAVYGTPENNTLFGTLAVILNTVLSLLGIALLVILIYAGFLWMTAAGNETQVKKAKTMLINAFIGLIILVSSYAIARFVVAQLNAIGAA